MSHTDVDDTQQHEVLILSWRLAYPLTRILFSCFKGHACCPPCIDRVVAVSPCTTPLSQNFDFTAAGVQSQVRSYLQEAMQVDLRPI